LLFNFVAGCLTRMIIKAQSNDMITSLIKHMIPRRIVVLQYVDDTILCLENNVEKASNVKLLLPLYE
jgi:hypothetical protein